MHKFWKIFKWVIIGTVSLIVFVTVGAGITVYVMYRNADYNAPDTVIDKSNYKVTAVNDSLRVCNGNTVFLNRYGLWEARVGGSPVETGACLGALTEDLLYYQEDVFVKRLKEMIPSERYLNFLRILIVVFNRNMTSYVPQENLEEIFAMSRFCSEDFNMIGSPYLRQLNYHAAHDIGHAVQEYMLVGCSSFGVWGKDSEDSGLVIGRNFDFYMGDDFAKNKMVLFALPDSGYKYASVTWPGMTGVLSGMNEKGLTVSINAAKGSLPTSSALPVSLLARNILQYAENIDQAFKIASSSRTFVSECLLIGSAEDGYAAIIEKTPEKTVLFKSEDENIKCTNHFQSDFFKNDRHNAENIEMSDSKYRFDRLTELVENYSPVSTADAAAILRDRYGLGNRDIGYTNQKSVNLSVAHHSVIFRPEELKMWVSTSPWQSGAYICYDIDSIFAGYGDPARGFADGALTLPADTSFLENDYPKILKFRQSASAIREAIKDGTTLDDSLIKATIASNPEYYGTYDLCGDYMLARNDRKSAVGYWKKALDKEIPYKSVSEKIEQKIRKYDKR